MVGDGDSGGGSGAAVIGKRWNAIMPRRESERDGM